jgi:hypothetical protein
MLTRKHPPRPVKTVESLNLAPRPIAPRVGLLDAALALPEPEPVVERVPLADEKRHMDRVAALGCLLCGQPAQLHHVREGQGMSQRASNFLVVPLCEPHHTGSAGLHGLGSRGFERRYRMDEMDLLAIVIARLGHTEPPTRRAAALIEG